MVVVVLVRCEAEDGEVAIGKSTEPFPFVDAEKLLESEKFPFQEDE
jgi:hypothetical protein